LAAWSPIRKKSRGPARFLSGCGISNRNEMARSFVYLCAPLCPAAPLLRPRFLCALTRACTLVVIPGSSTPTRTQAGMNSFALSFCTLVSDSNSHLTVTLVESSAVKSASPVSNYSNPLESRSSARQLCPPHSRWPSFSGRQWCVVGFGSGDLSA
jgi:hypothetical protein